MRTLLVLGVAAATALLFVAVVRDAADQPSWSDTILASALAVFLIAPVPVWVLYRPRRHRVSVWRLVITTAAALGAALVSLLGFTGDLLPTALLMTTAGLLQGGLVAELSTRRSPDEDRDEAPSGPVD